MAIFRSVKTRLLQSLTNRRNSSRFRTFFSLSLASPFPFATPFLRSNRCNNSQRHFLFRSRFLFPVGGPLFLSNPPWKLSQSATPLLLQSDVVLNFLKLRAINLLHRPAFPYNLGFRSAYVAQKLLAEDVVKEFRNTSEIDPSGAVTDSYLNLPNYISFTRLLSGPLLGWMITHDMYSSAFIGLTISGATDWVLIGCVALAMVNRRLLHPALVSLVVLRDIALVGGAVYKRASSLDWEWSSWLDFFNLDGAHAQKVEPLLISKVNTVFQLVLVAAALLQPVFGNESTQLSIHYLSWLVASSTVASTAAYGAQHLKNGTTSTKKFGVRT